MGWRKKNPVMNWSIMVHSRVVGKTCKYSTVRARVFGRHQFFGTSNITCEMPVEVYIWMNELLTHGHVCTVSHLCLHTQTEKQNKLGKTKTWKCRGEFVRSYAKCHERSLDVSLIHVCWMGTSQWVYTQTNKTNTSNNGQTWNMKM